MRIMALDIGKVRCGIAISDPQEKIATPLCVLPTEEVRSPLVRRLGTGTDSVWLASYYGWRKGPASAVYS